MDQAVQDGVGQCGVAYDLVPMPDGQLAGDQGRTPIVTVFEDLKDRLANWRKQTGDPLLDAKNLNQLTTEVRSVESKKAAKKHDWGYPDYFFGKGKKAEKSSKWGQEQQP